MSKAISEALQERGIGDQASLVLQGYSWEQYLSIDELFSESGVRVRFLDHFLEIMAPVSLQHENRKSNLGCLVESWCLDKGIEFMVWGNTTLTNPEKSGGEPDESYCFHEKKEFPDLVIEVALTSGGLSKRAFYATFGIPELWIWREDDLEIHEFNDESGEYDRVSASVVLPGIDTGALVECARMEFASQAIREFRKRIANSSDGAVSEF